MQNLEDVKVWLMIIVPGLYIGWLISAIAVRTRNFENGPEWTKLVSKVGLGITAVFLFIAVCVIEYKLPKL